MSVSSLASEGFYRRRPRAEFLFTRALRHRLPGQFLRHDWCGFFGGTNPSLPPQKHHQTGDWKGRRAGSCIPPKNLPNTWEQQGTIARYEIHKKLTRFFNRVALYLYKTQKDRTGLLGLVHDLGDLVSWQLKSWVLLTLNDEVNVRGN